MIQAVTVNHNTSPFVELMLRTLSLTEDLSQLELQVTVLDNGSNDAGLAQLETYLAEQEIAFRQTGFDNSLAAEKHGAALERFVLEHADCGYYLFLDSDIWFVEENTVATLLDEFSQADDAVFAMQAQIYGYYAHRVIEGKDTETQSWTLHYDEIDYVAQAYRRCSPVCSLIRNTALFQTVVEQIGLGCAVRFGVGRATYYDTFGLMTGVMATYGLRFEVSSKAVNHFTMTSYHDEGRGLKEANCSSMLAELRAERGMELDLFRKAEWGSG